MGLILKPRVGLKLNLSHPLAKGLVGCWLMNEGSGDQINDLSLNGHIGSFVNTPTWEPGRIGTALRFGGVDDLVSISNTPALQPDFPISFSAWCKPILGNTQLVMTNDGQANSNWSGLNLFINADGKVQALLGDNTGTTTSDRKSYVTTTSIPDNIWTHLCVVLNSFTDILIYFNGMKQSITSSGTATSMVYAGTNGQIGFNDQPIGSKFPYTGLIGDVRIWNRALSPQEIAQLHREPYAMFEQPMPIWMMDTPIAAAQEVEVIRGNSTLGTDTVIRGSSLIKRTIRGQGNIQRKMRLTSIIELENTNG